MRPQVHNVFAGEVSNQFISDINNPPTKRYVHQEYPKLAYKEGVKPRNLVDAKEEAKFLKDGWSLTPPEALPSQLDSLAKLVTRPRQEDLVLGAIAQRFAS